MFHSGTRRRTAFAGLAALGVLVAGCAHVAQTAPKPAPAPAIKGTAYTNVETQLIDAINRQRDTNDLKPLVRHSQLVTKARSWAAAMASGACGRDAEKTPRVCHSKLSGGISAKWDKLGENVGKASPRTNISAVVKKFAAENRKNILERTFDHIGVGVAYLGKHVYVVEVFMNLDNASSGGGTVSSAPRTTSPTTTKPPASSNGEIRFTNAYTTSYNWWDNNPPRSDAICCKALHDRAAGTGTYADPITVAVDYKSGNTMEFAPGTRFYIPNVRAYFIVEDRTGTQASQNANSHGGSTPHFDLWSDGRTSSESNAYNCMAHLTDTGVLVIQNPSSNYAVVSGALAANNSCRTLYGNAPVVKSGGAGASGTPATSAPRPTTAPSPSSVTAPPATSPAPKPTGGKYTVDQVLVVAYAAGFRSEAQLLAVAAIAVSESSLVVKQRNWHPEYGCRPASAVLGVALPAGACSGQPNRQVHSDRGIVQISSHWWPQYTDAQTDDPATAMKIMFTISKSGTDFTPWDPYKSGSAQSRYDRSIDGWPALRPIVRAFLA